MEGLGLYGKAMRGGEKRDGRGRGGEGAAHAARCHQDCGAGVHPVVISLINGRVQ